jgi:hydrogenase maturation protease
MSSAVIICIGNLARGDDGVARRVADLLEGTLPVDVRVIAAAQLDVVMADDLAATDLVIFVDAQRREHPPVDVMEVEVQPHGEYGHALAPGHLLEIAYGLYASRPRALLVSVAAPEMEHREGLSETAEYACLEAASAVRSLVG